MHAPNSLSLSAQILSLADRCVKCGLCLPHCPTYGLQPDENASPRGRIALLQGVAEGRLAPDAVVRGHLDDCLGCRRCERVCPAGVAFEQMMDLGRRLPGLHATGRRQRLALRLLGKPARLRQLHRGLRFLQRSGLLGLARVTGLLRLTGLARAARLLPPLPAVQALPRSANGGRRGRVALFAGCLGGTLEQSTVRAAIRVLEAFGYAVTVLETGCCGALAWHRGETALAAEQARALLNATGEEAEAILYLATGCGTHLQRYAELPLADDCRPQAEAFVTRLEEITAFLARQPFPADRFRADDSARTVAVHMPCSQLNGLRQQNTAGELLQRLPGLRVVPLPDNDRCCGAGGDAMLTRPAIADALRGAKLEAIARAAPDVVASTNPGCALFLNAGLGHDPGLPVVHPVVVMAERLKRYTNNPT